MIIDSSPSVLDALTVLFEPITKSILRFRTSRGALDLVQDYFECGILSKLSAAFIEHTLIDMNENTGMSGSSLIKQLKIQILQVNPDMKFFGMSGDENRKLLMKAGADAFFEKPFMGDTYERIVNEVEKILV